MSVQRHRARPWLGTLVEMHVDASDASCARYAIETAFAEVEAVHRCMSFHETHSDLSRLHASPVGTAVEIDARTMDVLYFALELAERSQGRFDPTIAARLVERGFLPMPKSPFVPDMLASWRDIELMPGNRVRLHRPLWLDLGGIAKGYAVDRATEALLAAGVTQALVNAGGDLRLAGPCEEVVHLRGADNEGIAGAVALRDAALASSVGAATRQHCEHRWISTHLDGRSGKSVGMFSAVSVIAPSCMIADALTKVALAAPPTLARRISASYGAQILAHSFRGDRRSKAA